MKFKIGSVVIGQHFINVMQYNGMEGTVIRFVPANAVVFHNTLKKYKLMGNAGAAVRWADGTERSVEFKNLRLKKPPQETTDWAAQQVKKLLNNIPQTETI